MIRAGGLLFALAGPAALIGCQSLPQRVDVPVLVPCRVVLPSAPTWATESLAADAGLWDQAKALLAERQQARGYIGELEVAARACG